MDEALLTVKLNGVCFIKFVCSYCMISRVMGNLSVFVLFTLKLYWCATFVSKLLLLLLLFLVVWWWS